jgi:Cyclic nucleotide-binding domain
MTPVVAAKKLKQFDPKTFLSTINGGRKIEAFAKTQTIFSQGDSSDAVFYIKEGKIKLTVVSEIGKEATIGILNEGAFWCSRLSARQLSVNSKRPCTAYDGFPAARECEDP